MAAERIREARDRLVENSERSANEPDHLILLKILALAAELQVGTCVCANRDQRQLADLPQFLSRHGDLIIRWLWRTESFEKIVDRGQELIRRKGRNRRCRNLREVRHAPGSWRAIHKARPPTVTSIPEGLGWSLSSPAARRSHQKCLPPSRPVVMK